MPRDAVGEIVPSVAGIKQPVVVLVLGAGKQHQQPATNRLFDRANQFRNTHESIEGRNSPRSATTVFSSEASSSALQSPGDHLAELPFEHHCQERWIFEVGVPVFLFGHPFPQTMACNRPTSSRGHCVPSLVQTHRDVLEGSAPVPSRRQPS